MKKLTLLTFILLYSGLVFALPEEVEVWFLSKEKTAMLNEIINKSTSLPVVSKDALAFNKDECVPMGDGCFHPQVGFVEKDYTPAKGVDAEKDLLKKDDASLGTFGFQDATYIDCDKEDKFNIFCGTPKKGAKRFASFEIWIDTSSSLREIDYAPGFDNCARKHFAEKILRECPEGSVSFSAFDTARKEVADLSALCVTYGLNNQKKIIRWIKGSKVKKLLLITDIDEHSDYLRNYLDSIGAQIKGADSQVITAADLKSLADGFIKTCKKSVE